MRKPEWNEIIVALYAGYLWFILSINPDFLLTDGGKSGSIYKTYLDMVGDQHNLANISLGITGLLVVSLLFKSLMIRLLVNFVAFIYFSFVASSYMINYPNLSFGIMMLIGIYLFNHLMLLIDKSEEEKKNKILDKHSIKHDCIEEKKINEFI